MDEGILGILGGMGPAATADFYLKLVRATPALQDQDHIPLILIGDPRIADRSHAIESGKDAEVLAGLLRGLERLMAERVDAIAIPCNTAHFWLPFLKSKTKIPFISLIEASVDEARHRYPDAVTALVLGTRATARLRLYDQELKRGGLSPVHLPEEHQFIVDTIISMVKAGDIVRAAEKFDELARAIARRADVVFLACTELPLAAASNLRESSGFIDTTAALVNACVEWSRPRTPNLEHTQRAFHVTTVARNEGKR